MKYIVEVNAKYLVSIEAESCLNAEHKLLEYDGIWGALAFDRDTMKTDTFAGAVQGCEMISMDELITIVNEAIAAKEIALKAAAEAKKATDKVAELEAMLKAAKEEALNANRNKSDALYKYDKAATKLGKQRN